MLPCAIMSIDTPPASSGGLYTSNQYSSDLQQPIWSDVKEFSWVNSRGGLSPSSAGTSLTLRKASRAQPTRQDSSLELLTTDVQDLQDEVLSASTGLSSRTSSISCSFGGLLTFFAQVATAATLAGAAVSASSAAFGYLLDTYTSDHDAASNGRAALSRQAANAALSAVCATLDALLPALLALTFTKERFSGAMLAVCGAAASALLAVHGAVFWLGEACPLVFSVAKQPLKTSAFLISTLYSAHHVGYAADAHGAVLKWATLWGIFSAVAGGYPWLQAAALRAVAFLGGGALAAAAVGAALHVAVFAPLTVFARHMARSAATEGGLRLAAFFTPFHYVCDLGRLRLVAALALKACAAASGSTVSLHADTTLSIAAVPGSEAEIVRLLAVSLLFSSVCKMHHRNADAYILGHLLGARFAAEAVVARFEEDEILISDWIAQMTAFIAVLCGAARSPLGGSALFGTTLSVGVLLSCAATKLAVECVVFLVHRKFYAVDYEVVLRHGGLAAPFASVALGLLGAASWMG